MAPNTAKRPARSKRAPRNRPPALPPLELRPARRRTNRLQVPRALAAKGYFYPPGSIAVVSG